MFIIEGIREIGRAKECGIVFTHVYFCPEIFTGGSYSMLNGVLKNTENTELSRNVFNKLVYREDSDGIFVIAKTAENRLDDFRPGNNPLIMVLETVEKPGNLGAIIRTADAAGISAVIVCDPLTDIYNPNVIRSSLGCLFSTQVFVADSESAIAFLKQNGVKIFAAALQDASLYSNFNYRGPAAFIMGSEADGLSSVWRKNADEIIKIPMAGIADSLNVSISAAVLVFEALRQRNI